MYVKLGMFEASPWRHGIDPRAVNVGFVVEIIAQGRVLLQVLRFPLTIFILPMLHTHAHPSMIDVIRDIHTIPPKENYTVNFHFYTQKIKGT
jgi:hypothetical protein